MLSVTTKFSWLCDRCHDKETVEIPHLEDVSGTAAPAGWGYARRAPEAEDKRGASVLLCQACVVDLRSWWLAATPMREKAPV